MLAPEPILMTGKRRLSTTDSRDTRARACPAAWLEAVLLRCKLEKAWPLRGKTLGGPNPKRKV